MKISWHWLQRHVDLAGLAAAELADRFTLSVAELEGLEEVGAGFEGVVAGRILEASPHPAAAHLSVLRVDLGGGGVETLVSAAPNARPGCVTAVAPPGVRLPAGEVRVAVLKGVESRGVTCSERDLGLTEEHEGLLELPPATVPGTPLVSLVPVHDWVIEIDNKSLTHRPDCWSHRGLAREIAALAGRPLRPLDLSLAFAGDRPVDVAVEAPDLCPRYTAVRFQGVTVRPSPLWLRILLHRVGVRPISNVVDLTNFVMLDVGNPVHAFDARFVRGARIVVRRGREGETLTTLDGQARSVGPADVIIADGAGGVALGGIMGGLDSEIVGDTTDVILESATFQASTIRRTSARLGLRTEASARFEKALDPAFAEHASRLFGRMLLALDPAVRVVSSFTDVATPLASSTVIGTSGEFIRRRLGVPVPDERIREILERLEFRVAEEGGELRVTVPTFRATRDVRIPEDLVEEIGRMIGYDNIPPSPPLAPVQPPPRPPSRRLERRLRHFMVLGGGVEVMLYSFDSLAWAQTLGYDLSGAVPLANPISADLPVLRRSLVPNLLAALRRNQAVRDELLLFELGRVFFLPAPAGGIPRQERHLGAVFSTRETAHPEERFREVKWVVERLAEVAGRGELHLELPAAPPALPWITPGRCLAVREAGTGATLGWIGQVNPELCARARLRGTVGFVELDLEPLIEAPPRDRAWRPLPRFPRIARDLSFIVRRDVTHEALAAAARAAAGEHLVELELVALFEGAPIPEGHKSLSYRLTFGAEDRTLRDDEIRPAMDAVVVRVAEATGGHLRDA